MLEGELASYGGLSDRPRLVALNKIDVPDARELAEMVAPELRARGYAVYPISAASREGLRELAYAMGEVVDAARTASATAVPARIVLRPKGPSDTDFTIENIDGAWHVHGNKPQRWIRQTDFSNDEAVGYLADRLNRLGVEETLTALGAKVGDDVVIGDEDNAVVFEFDPQVQAGAETLLGRRGRDLRLEGR